MTWCSFGAGGAIIPTAVVAFSLGNKRSAGLWPKEIHSVGPVQQLDRESVGAAKGPCVGDAKTPTLEDWHVCGNNNDVVKK